MLYLAGVAVLIGASRLVQIYFYPWIGVPVVGLGGLGPFLLAFVFMTWVPVKSGIPVKYEVLVLILVVPLGICLVTLLYWLYVRLGLLVLGASGLLTYIAVFFFLLFIFLKIRFTGKYEAPMAIFSIPLSLGLVVSAFWFFTYIRCDRC